MRFADQVLKSSAYCLFLRNNIEDCPDPLSVEEIISNATFMLDLISFLKHFDAYALVYRDIYPDSVFMNPLLLLQMKRAEVNNLSTEDERLYAYFVGCKLVHEATHLLQKKLSHSMQLQIVPKRHGGGGKRSTKSPIKRHEDGFAYTDFGEYMEKVLFGGIIEMESNPAVAFELKYLIIYAHPSASVGRKIIVQDHHMNVQNDLVSIKATQEEEEIDRPYKG
jgi:hypothetical protein